jgi:hypothetical protein
VLLVDALPDHTARRTLSDGASDHSQKMTSNRLRVDAERIDADLW